MLSPRFLFYGYDRLLFRCQNAYVVSGMNISEGPISDTGSLRQELLDPVFFASSSQPESALPGGSSRLLKSWSNIVESYSARSLTIAADKLPGLSGLAEEYERLTRDRYLAGLWKSALPGALMWGWPELTLSRPTPYRAPSWSWAAMEGSIQMSTVEDVEDLEFVDCKVKLKNSRAPFGEVTKGLVILRGRLMKARIRDCETRKCTVDISWWAKREPDITKRTMWDNDLRHFHDEFGNRAKFPPNEASGTVSLDTSEDASSELWLLKFMIQPPKYRVGGLVLTPVTQSRLGVLAQSLGLRRRIFRRIGTFLMDYYQEDCFKETKPQIVHIV